ncbi:MAG TPA: hypothetical protein DIT07_11680 [Sphingobacteriaceae bacterium]|nr:hypothetical protein [Sphingobacteriaceae bacterium]
MNFLSHFYFDKHSDDPELILGTVLPDLIKNANKSWLLHPEKRKGLFIHDKKLLSILQGWNRHILVDKFFHASDFFSSHTKIIRSAIAPLLEDSPVRPSFLSHIALELMLDSLLITEGMVSAGTFYRQLKNADRDTLTQFLALNEIIDPGAFFQFYDKFIASAYLNSYSDPHNIIYALNRICMRVWDDPLNSDQQSALTEVLVDYQEDLRYSFTEIFDIVDKQLKD